MIFNLRLILSIVLIISDIMQLSNCLKFNILDKAVLFDVDGTLSNSYKLGFDSTNSVLLLNNKPSITEEEYHQGTKFTTPKRLAWHVTGDPNHSIGETLGQQFDDLYVDLVSMKTAAFYPGILEMILNIKSKTQNSSNIKFGALSNACGAYVQAVLETNNVSTLFEVGLGADNVPLAKPNPDGLFQCCNMLNIHPSRAIYIGDSPSDGQAAERASMKSIGVTWGSHSVDSVTAAFTHTVHSIEELELCIQQLLSDMDN